MTASGSITGRQPIASSERPAIGAGSMPLRWLIAAVTVGIYVALGLALHLDGNEYQVLGIPLLLAFQLLIHRQPIRTLWVRSGPPLRVDARFISIWLVFSLVPAYDLVTGIQSRNVGFAAFAAAAIAGAFGLAYALRAMHRGNLRQLGLCILTVGALGILPQLAALVLPHLIHLHIAGSATRSVGAPTLLKTGAGTFFLGPAGFMVEEVFFRGGLDTYLHRGENGTGWLSAVFVSALWGLWHLPGQNAVSLSGTHLVSTILALLVAQIVVGVPLSLWWRASGNLAVTDTAHALLDSVRNSLALVA